MPVLVPLLFCCVCRAAAADVSIRNLLLGGGFPAEIKSKKGVARWDQIDQVLNQKVLPNMRRLPAAMRAEMEKGSTRDSASEREQLRVMLASSRVLFSDLFRIGESDLFPLTNSVLKLAPEESLLGISVFEKSGQSLGTFAGKSRYERGGDLYGARAYTLVTFEYETPQGEYRSAGTDNLLDKFVVRWRDIKTRPALDLVPLVAP
ncbi:MAG: hypothetical protein HY315_01555 [Acidobacteria bacterium]|nr:hypothetical protein [Acidobacteriota bacterium]